MASGKSMTFTSPVASVAIKFADFDIDPISGFLPSQAPLSRLPPAWKPWESALEDATSQKLQLGAAPGLSEEEKAKSESWRKRVRELAVLPMMDLKQYEVNMRRAHLVLTYLLHFYVHTLPPDVEILIPASISLPLLQVSAELQGPPVMAYSDDIMYNWALRNPTADGLPTSSNLRSQASFTGAMDEEAFYLAPVRVELRGAEALRLMQTILSDLSLSSADVIPRITESLMNLTTVIKDLRTVLLSVREDCSPDFFYRHIRPWLVGADSDPNNRPWIFEGIDRDPSLKTPTDLSGSSAAQSSLIQALDIFLGIAGPGVGGPVVDASSISLSASFARRMRVYMPRRHREFLERLGSLKGSLRDFVTRIEDAKLSEAYNAALLALKEFRDGHMIIVTLYVIGPSKCIAREEENEGTGPKEKLKGSAGGDLAHLLKDFREKTTNALLP
ncbi:Indoleamine 2,3-dioxygenase [Lyophyllum atratum]|nr:Indoleamine 2,3-dioxygenase [Lyophyllum atratum]